MSTPLFHYLLIHWLIAFIPIGLGIFVISKDRKNPLYQAFLRYNFVISWWGLFNLFMEYSRNEQQALFWDRVSLLGIVFIPASFLHFTWMYSGKSKYYKAGIRFCYLLGAFFFAFVFTPWMAKSATPKYIIPYFTDPGVLYHFFVFYFVFVMTVGNILVFKAYIAADSPQRKIGTSLFLIATSLSTIGGGGNFMVPYKIYTPILYPYGGYTFILYGLLITYTILRYRFLDIEVIIKKTLVFAGLFGMAMSIIALMASLTQNYFGKIVSVGPRFSMAISGLIIIILYEPTRKWLVLATDRFLFQKKEDFKTILIRLTSNIITILDLDKVGDAILSTLRESLHLECGAIILKDESGKGFIILNSFKTQIGRRHYSEDDIFIRHIAGLERIINLEDLSTRGKIPTLVLSRLDELKAVICIPLFLQKEMIGILTLGRKQSDEEFTKDEIDYFPTVAGQVAISLNNARLYDIQKKSQIEFIQQAKMAAVGTLSAGISHEIKNPLNDIMCAIEMFQMNSGFLKDHSKDEYEKEVNKVFESVMEDAKRAAGTISTLSRFAHKGEGELKSEPVNLEKEVDNAHVFLRSHLRQALIEFQKEFPSDLPPALGDANRINEVLLNIINNARQAIGQNGTIKVVGKKNGKAVAVDIIDDGPGMSEEIQQKIFDPFFTTKEQGEGTGLGLHICREILKRMKSKITVKSEVGKGTTFTVEFPVAE